MPDFGKRHHKLHYVEEGSGDPVVFVHGFVMDHTMFAAQFEDLPDRYRCIAVDLRGHGRSDCPDGPWSMQDSVDDVIAFIEGTNAAPCHLVGMSWGGMIAMRIAIMRPELVRSLVLIDTSADAEDAATAEVYRGYIASVEANGVTDELIEVGKAVLFAERYRTENPDGIAVFADRVGSMKPEAIVEGFRALIGRDSVVDRLGQIRVPTLVICGEEDVSTPMAKSEQIAQTVPGAELVRIPGAGHTTPIETPDLVNEAMSGFLARVG